jgi:hypothetical protein
MASILLSWLLTLPCAALCVAGTYAVPSAYEHLTTALPDKIINCLGNARKCRNNPKRGGI